MPLVQYVGHYRSRTGCARIGARRAFGISLVHAAGWRLSRLGLVCRCYDLAMHHKDDIAGHGDPLCRRPLYSMLATTYRSMAYVACDSMQCWDAV